MNANEWNHPIVQHVKRNTVENASNLFVNNTMIESGLVSAINRFTTILLD